MLFTNPLHTATRRVILPVEWENSPDDVQVNYYNYLKVRLIPSTDVYIGSRLIYRTNSLGCRGDDIFANVPVLAVFGDEVVHGDLNGSAFYDLAVEPFQIVNAGIEKAGLRNVVERVAELHEASPLSCAVIVAPAYGLIPTHPKGLFGPPVAETEWEDEMAKLPAGPTYVIVAPPTLSSWADKSMAVRLVSFLQAWCQRTGAVFLDARLPEPASVGGFKALGLRLLGRVTTPPAPPALVEFLQAHLQAMAFGKEVAPSPSRAPQQAQAPAAGPTGHGPDDSGKNYPLW